MYDPTMADRVAGSAALRRRQVFGRTVARGLGHVEPIRRESVALRSGAGVVPVACHGTEQVSSRPDDRPLNRRTVAIATEHIRSALADLVAQIAPYETRKAA